MNLRIGFNARSLVDPHIRGLTRYTVNLLKTLSRRDGHELFLFSDQAPAAAHLAGVHAELVMIQAPRETLWEAWALPKALRLKRIDVFHAPADRGLPLLKPCPCVVTIHNSFERSHWRTLFPSLKGRYWYWKNEITNRLNADAMITVSETACRELRALSVASEYQLRRVYPAPAREFSPDPSPIDDTTLLHHGIVEPYVLYVGGYDQHKNVDVLVHAFDSTRLLGHCLVIVASKQRGYAELAAKWRTLQCFPRLRLIEASASEIPSLYRRAQFFVNPSLWESFSFQLVEAMASGTPIIASDRSAIPEIAGDAAIYIEPGDVTSVAIAMERLAEDSRLRMELRGKGFKRVQQFSWDKTAEETIDVYTEVCSRFLGKNRHMESLRNRLSRLPRIRQDGDIL